MKVRPSMQDICDAMSIDYDELLEPSSKIPDGLTKAKWAEDRIRRFAGGKDWRQQTGTNIGEAKKRRDKQAQADESTAELNAAMAALTCKTRACIKTRESATAFQDESSSTTGVTYQ